MTPEPTPMLSEADLPVTLGDRELLIVFPVFLVKPQRI